MLCKTQKKCYKVGQYAILNTLNLTIMCTCVHIYVTAVLCLNITLPRGCVGGITLCPLLFCQNKHRLDTK